MNNKDYMARHVADLTGVAPQQVVNSQQPALGQTDIYKIQDEGTPFDPMGMAVEQGQKAIVVNVENKQKEARILEQQGRFARAVAEAMRPTVEVGKVDREGKVVGVKMPETIPEPRDAIMAAISAVGVNGRKGVYSELPFEAEDVPKDWEVIQTNDGGYMATPQENVNEVVENEKAGERSKTLGMQSEKKESHDRVVQISDVEGVAFHEETTDAAGQQNVIANALDIAGQIGGDVKLTSPQEVLQERATKYADQVSDEIYNSFATVEGARTKAYKDSQGLTTVGVGFNMAQEGAKKMWKQAGLTKSFEDVFDGKVELDDADMKALLGLTVGDSEGKAERRAKTLGVPWESMPEWHKAILSDIAFNTGDVTGWTRVFKETEPRRVLQQARRREGGKNTAGMDNRVARIGIMLGIIDTVDQAKALGLSLTNLGQGEVIAMLKKRAKAQPTIKMASL